MSEDTKGSSFSRRNFLKMAGVAATVAAGTAALSGELLGGAAEAAGTAPDDTLKGVCELHVHCEPDVKKRSSNALGLARACKKNGYRALMLKAHDLPTYDQAYLVRLAEPDFEIFGGLTLNKVYGDKVNVLAAQKALETSGNLCRCIWMPTQASAWDVQNEGHKGGIPVVDAQGKVLPEVVQVMELCAKANIMFATGHTNPKDCPALAKKAKEVGVSKFVVTHATSHIWMLTKDQLKMCLDQGAYVEHTFNSTLMGPGRAAPAYKYTSMETIAEYIRLAPDRTFLTTDFGLPAFGDPIDGMRDCISQLRKQGFNQKQIDVMVRSLPAMLVGLKA